MPWLDIIWDYEPGGNIEHIAEHDVTQEEVREVMESGLSSQYVSRSSGRSMVIGHTKSGRRLAVVYQQLDTFTVKPVTAYDVE